jgi:hypothetical protein
MRRLLAMCLALCAPPALADGLGPVELPDLGESRLVLPWSEFKGLLERLLEAREPEPEQDDLPAYTLSSAAFRGRLEQGPAGAVARLEAEIGIHVLRARGHVLVPVFLGSVPLAEASLDGKPVAFFEGPEGPSLVLEAKPGYRVLKLGLFGELDDPSSPSSVTFPVPLAPVASLTFRVPRRALAFELESGGFVTGRAVEGGSEAFAVLPGGDDATLSWGEQVAEDRGAEATLEAQVATLASLSEDAVKCVSTIRYRIRRGAVRELGFQLPAGVTVTDVTGRGAQPFTRQVAGEVAAYRVALAFEVRGEYELSVSYERSREEAERKESLPVLGVPEAVRQLTRIGVAAPSPMEVRPDEARTQGLRPIDVDELPSQVRAVSAQPLLFGMSSVRRDWQLGLEVIAHDPGEVLAVQVGAMHLDTLVTRQGGAVTRARLQINTQSRQFLRVVLPEGASLWSTLVAGVPVKPAALGGERPAVLVPLERARALGGRAEVEVTYHHAVSAQGCLLGRQGLSAPALDVDVGAATWNLHLPEGYRYRGFRGDFEVPPPERAARVLSDLPAGMAGPTGIDDFPDRSATLVLQEKEKDAPDEASFKVEGKLAKKAPRSELLNALATSRNVLSLDEIRVQAAEQQGLARGVLPVRVELDFTGVRVPASRQLIRPGQASELRFWYLSEGLFRGLHRLAQALVVLLALLVLSAAYQLGRSGRAGLTPWRWALGAACLAGLLGLHLFAGMWVPSPVKAFGLAALGYLAYLLVARRRKTLSARGAGGGS